jgi:predicted GNAT family acetyltransferase
MKPKKIIKYRSDYRTSFDEVINVSRPFLSQWVKKGFKLETIELDSIDNIFNLHNIVDDIFCSNWGYESMDQNQFSSWINSMKNRKNGSSLLYWVKIGEEKVGFAYLFEMPDKTIIFKTLGVLPKFQQQGLGNALACELHLLAKKKEAKKCIYAMVQIENRVNRMPDPDISIMREYESYIF